MIKKIDECEVIRNRDGIKSRKIFSNEKLEIIHIILEPEAELEKHISHFEVQFYVIFGEGIYTIGEETHVLKRDTIVDCPKQVERSWKNLSENNLELLVVKSIMI